MTQRNVRCARAGALCAGRTIGLCLLGILAAPALAGTISDPVLVVEATSSLGSGSFAVPYDGAYFDPVTGTYDWSLSDPVQITNGGGQVIATVQGLSTFLKVDPLININFLLRAGAEDVQINVTSALLEFDEITDAVGKVSGQVGATDLNGNGVSVTGVFAGNTKSLMAGFNVGGTPSGVFANLVDNQSAEPWGSTAESEIYPTDGLAPFGEAVDGIWLEFGFDVTGGDQVSGTSLYVAVPEPAALALLLVGSALLVRRR
jgi:hypothetical protein